MFSLAATLNLDMLDISQQATITTTIKMKQSYASISGANASDFDSIWTSFGLYPAEIGFDGRTLGKYGTEDGLQDLRSSI